MDVDAFAVNVSTAGVGNYQPFFPGNALPRIDIPNFADPTTHVTAGEGANNSGWGKFMDTITGAATAPVKYVHSAWDEVAGAPARAASAISKAEDVAVQAATGILSWTKWIVVGLIAFAVIYVVSFLRSFRP